MHNSSIGKISLVLALCLVVTGAHVTPLGAEVLQEVTVKEGDTLWSVANFYLKDPQRWPDILKYNKLPSSDLNVILPGMKLRVPILLIKEHLRAAHLTFVLNDVRFRRSAEAEWKQARTDMELFNDDGLRTMGQSRAKVKFPSGELLQMDENSLIILKPEKTQEEIDLLSGSVRASKTKILTDSSMVFPRIQPKGPSPDFKTKLKEDKTTLVEVYEGIVDVTAEGKTVTLTKGFGTEVKFRQPPSAPKILPPRPDMDVNAPSNVPGTNLKAAGKVTTEGLQIDITAPAVVPTRSGSGTGASAPQAKIVEQIISKYHVQVSTSPVFASIVLEETKPLKDRVAVNFRDRGLPDGYYYYRFSYVDELGFEGQHSEPVQFVIDTRPPALAVATPVDGDEVDTAFVSVEGTTEPGTTLRINDKSVPVDDNGAFITAIMPAAGINVITLAVQDRAGNVTKKELAVQKVKVASKKGTRPAAEKVKEKGTTLASVMLGVLTGVVILGVLFLLVN